MMPNRLFLAFLLLLSIPLCAMAGSSKTWPLNEPSAFAKGKLEGVAVLSTGRLVLAPPLARIGGLEANYIWDVAAGKDGLMFVATGAPAAVYAVNGDAAKQLFKCDDKQVLSVLALPDGSILAATAPQGIIYKIDAEGKAAALKELGESYVWQMALGPKGEVYCATGPNGRLIRLDMNGETKEVFKAAQRNLMCLAVDPKSGAVFTGTEPEGLVYRIEPDGKASVLFDAEENEVRRLLLGPDGILYAGTAQTETPQQPAPSHGPAQPSSPAPAESAQPPKPASGTPEQPPPPPRITAANSLYMIVPDKGAIRIAQIPGTIILSLSEAGEGRMFVGTGTQGRLLSVAPDGEQTLLWDFEQTHVSAMARDTKGSIFVGTSNTGSLWKLGAGYRKSGTMTSQVFDAGYLSRWGRIRWEGTMPVGTGIAVSLRTGNSREPDATWSTWSAPVDMPSGREPAAPTGQFAQMKIELRTDKPEATPLLFEAAVSYEQANRRPVITQLSVEGQQEPAASKPKSGQPPPSTAQPGKRTISWQANDPNDDELVFDLYYRGLHEQDWKRLSADIKGQTKYEWDTSRVPDGRYIVRLVTSDRAVRPANDSQEAERVTAPFVVDNRPPQVLNLLAEVQADGSYVIKGTAKDELSNITGIEVSHNSENWLPVFPADGIFDSTAEEFSYHSPALAKGEHVFVFAATDAAGNTGSEKVVITLK